MHIRQPDAEEPEYRLDFPHYREVFETTFEKGVIKEFLVPNPDDPCKVEPMVKVEMSDGGFVPDEWIPIFYHPKEDYWDTETYEATDLDREKKAHKAAWMSFRAGDEVVVMMRPEGHTGTPVPKAVVGFADNYPRIGENIFHLPIEGDPWWMAVFAKTSQSSYGDWAYYSETSEEGASPEGRANLGLVTPAERDWFEDGEYEVEKWTLAGEWDTPSQSLPTWVKIVTKPDGRLFYAYLFEYFRGDGIEFMEHGDHVDFYYHYEYVRYGLERYMFVIGPILFVIYAFWYFDVNVQYGHEIYRYGGGEDWNAEIVPYLQDPYYGRVFRGIGPGANGRPPGEIMATSVRHTEEEEWSLLAAICKACVYTKEKYDEIKGQTVDVQKAGDLVYGVPEMEYGDVDWEPEIDFVPDDGLTKIEWPDHFAGNTLYWYFSEMVAPGDIDIMVRPHTKDELIAAGFLKEDGSLPEVENGA